MNDTIREWIEKAEHDFKTATRETDVVFRRGVGW